MRHEIYEGGELVRVEDIADVVAIPLSVTMRQARLAMLEAGMLDAVTSAIAAMPGTAGAAARIEWEFAADVRRDWPLVQQIATSMNLTGEQIDQLFILAASK